MHETAEPVQRDAAESRRRRLLTRLGGNASVQLAFGLVPRLPRDVHGGAQPVRDRKAGQQRQRAARLAQSLFTPADRGQPEMMPPVVGFERDRASRRGERVGVAADAIEHEPQRRPRLAIVRPEPACLARVLRGQRQRSHVRRLVGPRHLELHDAGVGEADVRRCLVRRAAQHALEDAARAHDLVGLERLERCRALNPRPMRREQRVERIV